LLWNTKELFLQLNREYIGIKKIEVEAHNKEI